MASQPSDRTGMDVDDRLIVRGATVLGTLVALAVVLFFLGLSIGIEPVLQRPTTVSVLLDALRHLSGSTFVVLSVLVVLAAPYATMLTLAGSKARKTRLWFALGTISVAVASLVAAWIAR